MNIPFIPFESQITKYIILSFSKVLPTFYDWTKLYDIFKNLKEVKNRRDVLILDDLFVLERKKFLKISIKLLVLKKSSLQSSKTYFK
jgi:hypothetical protein